jgi:hypothetical protein
VIERPPYPCIKVFYERTMPSFIIWLKCVITKSVRTTTGQQEPAYVSEEQYPFHASDQF